ASHAHAPATTPRRPRSPEIRAVDARTGPAWRLEPGARVRADRWPQPAASRAVHRPGQRHRRLRARPRPAAAQGLPGHVQPGRRRPALTPTTKRTDLTTPLKNDRLLRA